MWLDSTEETMPVIRLLLMEKNFPYLCSSGVLQGKKLFIAQGVVIEPSVLLKEIDLFAKRGLQIELTIDPRVHIVMPYHKELDRATELWKGKSATGSLHLGIGYCYEDKNNRFGIRFEDLIDPKVLRDKLETIFPLKKRQIELVYGQKTTLTIDGIYQEYARYGKKLKKYLGDVSLIISAALGNDKKRVLFEGAHGTFLDAIFGTYPFTTAVYTISGGVFPYVGVAPQKIYTLGVVKAYTTRVGNGPFPTELSNEVGRGMRRRGGEFGTVSKRPRRCGWLDLVLARTAARLSGFDYLSLTKLDVLSSFENIKVCTHYILHGKKLKEAPAGMKDFADCKAVYKIFRGWKSDISNIRKFTDLPGEAKTYIKFIEKNLKVPVRYVFVGPDREQTILM